MAFYPHLQPPRPEVRAFFEDIREYPEDATPRLVLADWLQEQPDECDRARGELIHLQHLLSQPGVANPDWRSRVRQLIDQFANEWLGPLTRLVDGWRFEGGFLHLAIQGYRCFARELQELIPTETFAWVEGLTLRRVTGGFLNVAEQLPLFRQLQSLTLEESRPGDQALGRLVALSALEGLRSLNLAGCQVSATAVQQLANHARLPNLRSLDLTRNNASASGVEVLAQSTRLPELRELRLGYNLIPDAALTAFAGSPLLTGLESLDLRGNQGCGGVGVAALVQSATHLRRLDLTQTRVTPVTVEALLRSPVLRELNLSRTNAGNEMLKQLAFTEGLPALERLALARTNLTDAAVIALGQGIASRKLRMLDLAHNHLDREAATALASSPAFAKVEDLDLEDNRIGDQGALALARSSHFHKLHFLDVANNGMTEVGKRLLRRRFGGKMVLV